MAVVTGQNVLSFGLVIKITERVATSWFFSLRLPLVEVVHNASLPAASQLEEANNAPRQSLRGALQLLAAAPNVKPEEPAETTADDEADINAVDFEYVESFGSDWEERWALGPAVQDENGKEIKTGLINAKLVKLGLEFLLIIGYVMP